MPVADTELLFGLIPGDRHHQKARASVSKVESLVVPEAALLEFMVVLRSRGTAASALRRAALSLQAGLDSEGLGVAVPLDLALHADAAGIEAGAGLSLFDSLVAASGRAHDGWVVSDDEAFDRVAGLRRLPLGKPWARPSSARE